MKRISIFLICILFILGLPVTALSADCTEEGKEHTAGTAVQENLIEAQCEVDGSYDSVVYCTVCGEEISRTSYKITHPGHTAGSALKENEIPATCKTDGSYEEVVYCSVCHTQISRNEVVVPSPGHNWNDGSVTKEPKCNDVGEKVYTCTVCHETKYVEIPKVDHSYKDGVCVWCGEKESVIPDPPHPSGPPSPPVPPLPPQPPLRLTVYSTTNGEVHTGSDVVPNGRSYIVNPGDSLTFTFHPYNQYYVYDVIFNGRYYGCISAYTVTYDMMNGQNRALNVKFASIYASPKTGDDSSLVLWTALSLTSLIGIGVILKRKSE